MGRDSPADQTRSASIWLLEVPRCGRSRIYDSPPPIRPSRRSRRRRSSSSGRTAAGYAVVASVTNIGRLG